MSAGAAFPTKRRVAKALLMGSALVVLSACHRGSSAVPHGESLEHGVYVAYSLGCDQGCREVRRDDMSSRNPVSEAQSCSSPGYRRQLATALPGPL